MDTNLGSGSRLERVLQSGRFAVTAELNPPGSADPEDVCEKVHAKETNKRDLQEIPLDAIVGSVVDEILRTRNHPVSICR